MPVRYVISSAALVVLISGPAFAQVTDQAGTSDGSHPTSRALHTARTGQTVPNPADFRSLETDRIGARPSGETYEDKITRGICIGCSR